MSKTFDKVCKIKCHRRYLVPTCPYLLVLVHVGRWSMLVSSGSFWSPVNVQTCDITGAADSRAAGLPDVLHPGDTHQQGQGGQGGQEASLGLPYYTGERREGREEGGQGRWEAVLQSLSNFTDSDLLHNWMTANSNTVWCSSKKVIPKARSWFK